MTFKDLRNKDNVAQHIIEKLNASELEDDNRTLINTASIATGFSYDIEGNRRIITGIYEKGFTDGMMAFLDLFNDVSDDYNKHRHEYLMEEYKKMEEEYGKGNNNM